MEGPVPDAEMMGPFFENRLLCLALYEKWHIPPGKKDVLDKLTDVFTALHPHVFQELWTTRFPFIMEQVMKHTSLLGVPQSLLAKDTASEQLVSIMLRHLVGDLESLGNQDTKCDLANVQDVFHGGVFIARAERDGPCSSHIPIDGGLLPISSKICGAYALLLAASCIVSRNRWSQVQHMYTVVTPLLQELLETLNRLLASSPPNMRDLFAELCLTVPVRLAHLLPCLGY